MKYTDLVESGATDTEKQEFLVSGDTAAITIRIPKNLRDAGKEAARLRGVSFSAFIRTCIINELTQSR
ncbi:hypothetical protein HLV37_00585 [Eggerthellaceae bacterium zg-1084]|uniref:YlcI/YnfO family protein n=1 Tax=Berryella wangjianweii TaxID=2734634 RepID=UPI001557B991|nr:YlcI/YnfO family protein [Berryella wangjianweii]NPD30386.1 hypothetical protein [Berryella wangjianweii]